MRTVRIVLHVGESGWSAEKKLSRSRFSFASFLLKRKEGGRFLFLKKRNKRHCGIVDLSEKRCVPAHSAWSIKTDGSHTNRPFCGAGWRKRQERRKEAQPQSIFFCFFSSKKKRRRPFCAARRRKQQKSRKKAAPQLTFFCVVGLHGKAGAQARRTRAETRRRREAYPLRYSDRRQRRMCLRPSV